MARANHVKMVMIIKIIIITKKCLRDVIRVLFMDEKKIFTCFAIH